MGTIKKKSKLKKFFFLKRLKQIKTVNEPIGLPISLTKNNDNSTPYTTTSSAPKINRDEFTALSCIESLPFSTIDFICSLLVAFQISCICIHVTRENMNKSKYLQIISMSIGRGGNKRINLILYWASNFLFDCSLLCVNIFTMCLAFKILFWLFSSSLIGDDNDFLLIASNNRLLYSFFVYMCLACGSWATCSYLWSCFFTRSSSVSFTSSSLSSSTTSSNVSYLCYRVGCK
jgi:hypothetical protein